MSDVPSSLADYLSEDQQACELRKTVRTLRRWRKKREGPPFTKNGKDVLYRRDWTAQWLAGGKQVQARERRRSRRRTDDHAST